MVIRVVDKIYGFGYLPMTKTLLFKDTAARPLRGEGSFPTSVHDDCDKAGTKISVESR